MTSTDEDIQPYPFGPAERLDLHPHYARLRDEEPVAKVRLPFGSWAWLVTRHEDVKLVMADPRFRRTTPEDTDTPRATESYPASRDSFLTATGAEHLRLRKLVARAFSVPRIEKLRPRAQSTVDGLLDDLLRQGRPADLAGGLAWLLPVTMICELLGADVADRDRFAAWAIRMQGVHGLEEMDLARAELGAYFADLVARRRKAPADDLVSVLITAREGEKLTEAELISLCMVLLVGGFESTANQISNSIYALLARPELWEQLVDNPELAPRAVEELLRFLPLIRVTTFPVMAAEDVDMDGVLIRAGDAVVTAPYSANRDPAVFARPEEIDLGRTENPHLTFSHGAHHCLGAPLARMELQVVIGTLARRLPSLRLAIPAGEVAWSEDSLLRTVETLPVTW
ncbi:cytochrome P450 [Amycolatopsis sp. lyj-112]|uniref:cytochrome P450 n=1 Tax=Amycolatopsis sp. lyj-112 TaxID=2789288 RepID=UPI0039790214